MLQNKPMELCNGLLCVCTCVGVCDVGEHLHGKRERVLQLVQSEIGFTETGSHQLILCNIPLSVLLIKNHLQGADSMI